MRIDLVLVSNREDLDSRLASISRQTIVPIKKVTVRFIYLACTSLYGS